MRLAARAGLLTTFIALGAPSVAFACTSAGLAVFVPDNATPAPSDRPPPPIETIEVVVVGDGQGPIESSCDDVASVELRFATPADDRTPARRLGYRLAFVDGVRPTGMPWPDGPVLARVEGPESVLRLDWLSGGEPTEWFRVSVTPVDGSGQPAATAIEADIEIPATDGGGCQVGRGSPSAGALWIWLPLVARRRRRGWLACAVVSCLACACGSTAAGADDPDKDAEIANAKTPPDAATPDAACPDPPPEPQIRYWWAGETLHVQLEVGAACGPYRLGMQEWGASLLYAGEDCLPNDVSGRDVCHPVPENGHLILTRALVAAEVDETHTLFAAALELGTTYGLFRDRPDHVGCWTWGHAPANYGEEAGCRAATLLPDAGPRGLDPAVGEAAVSRACVATSGPSSISSPRPPRTRSARPRSSTCARSAGRPTPRP